MREASRLAVGERLSGRDATLCMLTLLFTLRACLSSAAPSELTLLGPDYPRVFFFRASESGSSRKNLTYEKWEAEFDRLMGVMGKCLDEELPGRERLNPDWYGRFKRDHPGQAVLLHFNGNARDPRHASPKYFPGHWIYRAAVKIVADVPAEEGESVIRVADAGDFRTESGRYHTSNDDLALVGLAADGRHDWTRCEQVQLMSVDRPTDTIRVRRGCYGTKPLAFKAGASRAAAHAVEGPWGKTSHLLWFYNFATHCPRDAEGQSCADRLVDELGGWFGAGGKLAAFDGVEFDVMFNETRGDTDGDGVADDGVIGGVNRYGIGSVAFARQLRARLGEERLILGDGALGPGGVRSQRAFGIINGIESEGWPNLDDWDFDDWSGGLNRQAFWMANACPPAFSYINHKWVVPVAGKPGEHKDAEVPLARHRLVFAAAQLTDSMICCALQPPREAQGRVGIWDEFVCGTEGRLGWLGRPLGPAVRLAAAAPDRLGGIGAPAGSALAARIAGPVSARATAAGVVVTSTDPSARDLAFAIRDVPVTGEDLTVLLTMQGEPRTAYPPEMARFAEVGIRGGALPLTERDADATGMALRGRGETPINEASGARAVFQPGVKIGDRILPAYAIHPPFKAVKGYVYWCRDVEVPPETELRFCLGMSEKAPARSDGVWFRVAVAEFSGGKTGAFKPVFEESTKAHAWLPRSVPLAPWAGKRVRIQFVADCGPHDNATTDQGFWGDVKLVRAGVPESEVTPPRVLMTWMNAKPFASSFYFRGLRSKRVDLTFHIEGGESVTLRALTAHAASDAQYRLFEHGVVLANPGHAPVTFSLAGLAPGRAFRRIHGTAGQDLEANSGEPVGASLTLGPLEGLFLSGD